MTTTRSYSSPLRAEQAERTRRLVLGAASALFVSHGWGGTSVRMVAKEAGVSVETVYSSVGAKAELLKVAVDVAIVGDDDPVPLEARPEFHALGEGTQDQRCRALALLVAGIHRRAGALRRVVAEAAGADQGLRELDAELYAQEHASWTAALRRVRGSEPSTRLVDQLTAVLGVDVHHVLTGPRGWSADDYISWAADMAALLLKENP